MTTALLNVAVVIAATFAGILNLRRTYRPMPNPRRVTWLYAGYQSVVAVVLMSAWLWWTGGPFLSVAAITWTLCVPAHLIRAAKATRHDNDHSPINEPLPRAELEFP
jgi:hypothetical protein